ncbi:right-handed parallel beta-helix repeat-containing protein [Sulfitobacter albidus]|uniref:Right-handed parallel beta-helix repeat-containing protein n=1 Tax=Sulfitobacter albidus TaxID=2829501 RepID=A0A975PMP9_9RHOB|nr:glycosyl hydrolase family 28-related protein [Sulfitobacter albidus]QUJ76656.1 right-handed parallel beta-helix repeat-containing protein [Sulfitobacter albidus]
MNKAITDGIQLTPSPYANGLDQYSSSDGTPGSPSYNGAANAAFVPADQDFGGALELLKTESTQRLRYKGETPIVPGCYLQIKVRIKAISGNLPTVRIAAYAARSNGTPVPGVVSTGPNTALTTYGQVVEITAIVGIGNRTGVDMVWGPTAAYGHFGIDLLGQNGGVVRIDDIEINDVSSVFLGDVVSTIDVRDYGAVGNGTTDDTAAFEAANAAANGRTVLIPNGVFRLNGDVTFDTRTKFEGTVTMPTEAILLLRRNYDLPNYIEAFGNEELAFRKAFQALLNNSDHESLDLGGRKVALTGPIDMQAAVPSRSRYSTRRAIHNGQLIALADGDWATTTITAQATYSPGNPRVLSNVANIANIEVGSHVTGAGVGREVYVRSKNVARGEITLNAALYDAAGTQNFTFRRFKYLLDFSGFEVVSKFVLHNIEFQCSAVCSGILLAGAGTIFTVRDCFITTPKDRGITSMGGGCQGMFIERNQFLSAEDSLAVSARSSIALNVNANDAKIRNNRATRFKHFAVLSGKNHLVSGNHFFQGDTIKGGIRSAGVVLAEPYASFIFTNNYSDNAFLEWTNERDPEPAFSGGFSFSAMEISSNVFLSGDVAPSFSYIVVKPHGADHFLNGVNITGNQFRSINGSINRAERIDTSFAAMNLTRTRNVRMQGNNFFGVVSQVTSPYTIEHEENTPQQSWLIDTGSALPFQARALSIDAVAVRGGVRNAAGAVNWDAPFVRAQQGPNANQVLVVFSEPVEGKIGLTVRIDNDLV